MSLLSLLGAILPLFTFLIATVARFAVRIFLKLFDWSTDIFFGKIPPDRSNKLIILSVLSMLWVVMLVGLIFPGVSQTIYIFLPKIVRNNSLVVYILNGAGVFLLPLLVGTIAMFWNMDKISISRVKAIPYKRFLLGFYYAFLLGISFWLMFIFGPIIKAVGFIKKRKMLLYTVIIQEERYNIVLFKIRKSLLENQIKVDMQEKSFMYEIPLFMLKYLRKNLFKDILIEDTKCLKSKDVEIYIHNSDIMIVGKEEIIKKVNVIISEVLLFDTAYLTVNADTQQIERRILNIYSKYIISGKSCSEKFLKELKHIGNQIDGISADFNDIQVIKYKKMALENMIYSNLK